MTAGWREPGSRRGELLRRLLGRGRRGDARLDATPFGLPETVDGPSYDEAEVERLERAARGQGPARPL